MKSGLALLPEGSLEQGRKGTEMYKRIPTRVGLMLIKSVLP